MLYQDLHTHTTVSDGKMSYRQVLDAAGNNNIGVVAFTDHDLVPGEKELKQLDQLRDHLTKWVVGVEISAKLPMDLGQGAVSQLHIVGLFVDPANKALVDYGQEIVAECLDRMKKIVKAMTEFGFDISIDDCLKEATGQTIQRPHLVAALLKKDKNLTLIKKVIADIREKGKKKAKMAEFYKEIEKVIRAEPGNPYRQAFYPIFLTNNAFVKGAYFSRDFVLDLDQSVELIRNAGGLAILAHWSECRHGFPIEMVEKVFKEKRMDGAEIVYDLYRIGLGEEDQLRQEQDQIKKLVKKYHLLASGGSDAHDLETIENFSQTEWFAKQTVGLVEKMMEEEGIFKGWQTVSCN